jgi:hypothetical protein
MVAARRDEGRLGTVASRELEAEDAAGEGEGPVGIGHLQVHVADVGAEPSTPTSPR